MSLVGWWPLDGTLEDYSGNKNNMVVHSEIKLNTHGKIGECYAATTPSAKMETQEMLLKGSQSMCIWMKLTSYASDPTAILTQHKHSMTANFGLNLAGNKLSVSIGYEDGTREWNERKGKTTIELNKWYHIAMTYNDITKELITYVNGVVDYKGTVTKTIKFVTQPFQVNRWSVDYTSDYTTTGFYNDVRIYDHALTAKEIKEIAKAKIIHYKFDQPQESTTNYIQGGSFSTGQPYSCYEHVEHGKFEFVADYFAPTSNMAYKLTAEQDDCYTYPYLLDLAPVTTGSKWTASIWARGEKGGEHLQMYIFTKAANGEFIESDTVLKEFILTREWQRYTLTVHIRDAAVRYICPRLDNNLAGDIIYFNGYQLENKDYASPFVETKKIGYIEDYSGLRHKATASESRFPKWQEEGVISKGCYTFETAKGLYLKAEMNKVDTLTVSFWVKLKDYTINEQYGSLISIEHDPSSYPLWIFYNKLGKICILSYSLNNDLATNGIESNAVIPLNQWTQITVTSEKGGKTILYVNGKKITEFTNKGAEIHNPSYFYIGDVRATRNLSFNGSIDDVKFYATVLSEEAVKQDYHSRAAISKNGTVFVKALNEVCHYDKAVNTTNLIRNGSGEYGDTTNFEHPNVKVITTDGYKTNNCLEIKGYITLRSTDYIPVNTSDVYELIGYFKSMSSEKCQYYFGVACYDRNKQFIFHAQVNHYKGTDTTLAAPLTTGATTVQLTSSKNWTVEPLGESNHTKQIGIFSRPEAPNYERATNVARYLTIKDNLLTLEKPWSYETVPAGTKVANVFDGGAYNYVANMGSFLGNQWKRYAGKISTELVYGNSPYAFRYGTCYVKIIILANYRGSSELTSRCCNLTFVNRTRNQNVPFSITAGVEKTGTLNGNSFNEIGITRGMIAYYPFDQDVKDYSGYQHHLTGTYKSVPGIKGHAYDSRDPQEKLATPFQGYNAMTISAWGYATSTNANMLFSFNNEKYSGPTLYFAHDTISWNTGNGGDNAFKKDGEKLGLPPLNKWIHYCVVVDPVLNKVILYCDGVHAGDANYVSPKQGADRKLTVGAYSSTNPYYWKGLIDHFKVFNRVLSQEEIQIEYQSIALNKTLIHKDGTIFANCFDEILI